MMLLWMFIGLLVFDFVVWRWGCDSREGVNDPEWARRRAANQRTSGGGVMISSETTDAASALQVRPNIATNQPDELVPVA